MTLQRRAFITGLTSFLAAPAIVRASSLMPVRAFKPDQRLVHVEVTILEPNEAWLRREFQRELEQLLASQPPIQYNEAGYKQIEKSFQVVLSTFDCSSGYDIKCAVVYQG